MFLQLLNQLNEVPSEIIEAIDLFKQIPNNDPLKYNFYKNIETLLEIENERYKESKIKIRLLNQYESGLINLDQLAKTANHVQQAYTSVLGNLLGVVDGRSKKYPLLLRESKIITSIDAGSFIFSIDKIGENIENEKIDIFLEEVEKEELFVSFLSDVWELDKKSEDDYDEFIDKYGYRSLKHIEKWFDKLATDETAFELMNSYKWEKDFSVEKITVIKDKIKKIDFVEDTSTLTVNGKLLTIDSVKNKLVIDDVKNGELNISIQNGLLQLEEVGSNLRINKKYTFKVIKNVKKFPGKTITKYLLASSDELLKLK